MSRLAPELENRLQFALRLAEAAGALTLEYFLAPDLGLERKADDSPVTRADRAAEVRMREMILHEYPDDGVIGEEFGATTGASGYRWVLDPIDGTKSFITGVPLYSVLVGLLREEESVAGVIRIPALGECVYAARGGGAWWQRGGELQPAHVSSRALSEGAFLTSQVDTFAARNGTHVYSALEKLAYITRTWGDGYGYLLVATGRAEVIVDPIMNVWDAAPLLPILQEAGGIFCDWQGEPTVHHGEGIGCSRTVLADVLEFTRAAPRLP